MAKKKDKTIWWILAIGGAGAAWYLLKNHTAAANTVTTTPADIIPESLALKGGTTSLLPPTTTTGTAQSAVAPQLVFNTPTFAPPSNPPVAITSTTPSPIPAAPTGPTADQLNTLQSWAQSSLNPCDLSRWNQYKSSFTPAEWAALVDIYFNDWVGGQGNTPERVEEWDNWRGKYQILTNTPC